MINEAETYVIHLPVYEGPLDLLLELIEQTELDITKVALAQVTDQYLSYLRRLQEHHLEDLTSFLVIAARLIQIKSEALLPRPPQREPGEEDPGDALARQLIEYKRYKEVATILAQRMSDGYRSFIRIIAPPAVEPKLDMMEVTLDDLRIAFVDVLSSFEETPAVNNVIVPHHVRVRDKIRRIIDNLTNASFTTFHTILEGAQSRLEIVVSFIAILELIKQHRVSVQQESLFGEITLTRGENWSDDQEVDFELEFDE
jgi:segregation and condensation protein A